MLYNADSTTNTIDNLTAQLVQSERRAEFWRTQFYDQAKDNEKLRQLNEVDSSSPNNSAQSFPQTLSFDQRFNSLVLGISRVDTSTQDDAASETGIEVNSTKLIAIPVQLTLDATNVRKYLDELLETQEELVPTKMDLMKIHAKLKKERDELAKARVELVREKTLRLKAENKLSLAQALVKSQEKTVTAAQN